MNDEKKQKNHRHDDIKNEDSTPKKSHLRDMNHVVSEIMIVI